MSQNRNKGNRPKRSKRKDDIERQKDIKFKNRKKNFKPSSKHIEYVGTVSMARDGYAFVVVESLENDIFVSASRLRGALNGDMVRVAVKRSVKTESHSGKKIRPKRVEGEVTEIVKRSDRPHIGILQITDREAWVMIESRVMPYDIKIPINDLDPKLNGNKVAVKVVQWPKSSQSPIGEIVDVLGVPGNNDTEMHAILAEYSLPYRFEDSVLAASEEISDQITEKDISSRRDFRNVPTITIDPSDAKDFDDAISLRGLENGNFEVGVHIADVTHYVRPGSVLEKVAYERATSVYLVDRTIPMLPEKLSNRLCSLRPNEDKLCFSAVFEMNDKAKVIDRWFGRTVINSDRRFDYEEAQQIIETKEGDMSDLVITLHELAKILREKRFEAGAINFERPEMKVLVDETGKPVSVEQKISKESNWLIEEFMLLANRSVAEYVGKKRANAPTFVYRIHDKPNPDKIEGLREFIRPFGYKLKSKDNQTNIAGALNDLFNKSKGKPEAGAIELIALRSMAKARYSTDNIGHYGLAFDWYTHFTSPIRRYPDMMVHRLLAIYLENGKSQDKGYYEECCKYSSEREQVAVDAERASIKYKVVEFMRDKLGEEFDGTISGLTEWGMYVEIEPTKIEGMVPLHSVKEDYFMFDQETFSLIGKGTGRRYTLGDKVRVKVTRANLEQKILDYELVQSGEAPHIN